MSKFCNEVHPLLKFRAGEDSIRLTELVCLRASNHDGQHRADLAHSTIVEWTTEKLSFDTFTEDEKEQLLYSVKNALNFLASRCSKPTVLGAIYFVTAAVSESVNKKSEIPF